MESWLSPGKSVVMEISNKFNGKNVWRKLKQNKKAKVICVLLFCCCSMNHTLGESTFKHIRVVNMDLHLHKERVMVTQGGWFWRIRLPNSSVFGGFPLGCVKCC